MAGLTRRDCHRILKSRLGRDAGVVCFAFEPYPQLQGFHGVHGILRVEVDGPEGSLTFFVKSSSKNSRVDHEYFSHVRCYYKEHVMFTEVLKEYGAHFGPKVAPECYLSILEDVLVLEDLTAAGFECRKVEMDLEHARAAAGAFANLHAACFVLEKAKGEDIKDLFPHIIYETFFSSDSLLHDSFESFLRDILDEYFQDLSPQRRDKFARYIRATVVKGTSPSSKYKNVLCHGDPWGNNILYKYDGDSVSECVLVDFQNCRYVPPAAELMQFLRHGTTPAFMEAHGQAVLDHYYASLGEALAPHGIKVGQVLPRKAFNESCDDYRRFATCIHVYYAILTRLPDAYLAMIGESEQSFIDVMAKGKSAILVKAFKEHSYYRYNLTEVMHTAMNYMDETTVINGY